LQLLTVPCCETCNNSWSEDEAHFRDVLVLAGDPTGDVKSELWDGPVSRGFEKSHSVAKLQGLLDLMKAVETSEGARHKIYPENDEEVLRVVRKMIRGLSYEQGLATPVLDDAVIARVLTIPIPDWILDSMTWCDRDADVAVYGFTTTAIEEFHSVWILGFFRTVYFIGAVLPQREETSNL
jgi:hypothetical protein